MKKNDLGKSSASALLWSDPDIIVVGHTAGEGMVGKSGGFIYGT